MESRDAEAMPVDQRSLPVKSPWQGRNPKPRFYDEINDTFVPDIWVQDIAAHFARRIDDEIMSTLRLKAQDDGRADGNPT